MQPQSAIETSGSLVETLLLEPFRTGSLDGFTFTIKDNIDIAGKKTSYGSPHWRERHPAAVHNALCVDQLLGAVATCVGKVIADEFTYRELWSGQSLKYWADAIDRRPAYDMLRADTEFLLIQGARDASTSSTARAVSDLFAKDGRCNLTY